MVFGADDLGAWLVAVLADAGRRKLTTLVLGTDQERALRRAAAAAVQLTAVELRRPGSTESAGELAMVVSQVFADPAVVAPLRGQATLLDMMRAGIARQLAVLDDASLTGTGRSSAEVLAVPTGTLAQTLTGHLLQEIAARGTRGGPLEPLAAQLNHDRTYLQGRQIEGKVDRLAEELSRIAPPDGVAMSLAADRMMRHEIASRLNQEHGRDLFITSQVHDAFEIFLDSDWRADCKRRVQALITFCRSEQGMGGLVDLLADVDWGCTFEVLRSALNTVPLEHASEQLAALAARPAAPAADPDRRRAITAAQAHARWLIGQGVDPRFRVCLPVLGSWGSGKSRLLIEIAKAQRDQHQFVIFLGPDFSGSLRDELLARSGELLGWRPADVATLARCLSEETGKRLVVLFDDLGDAVARRPEVLDAVTSLISECTAVDAIRWVVTADDLRLDYLLTADHRHFWKHYGYQPEKGRIPGIGGWLFLDDVNGAEQVGLQLMERRSDGQSHADIAEIRKDIASFDYAARSLCNPLPAWLRLEVPEGGSPAGLVNIYLEQFVTAYWKRRNETLAADHQQAARFDWLVTILARRLAAMQGDSVALTDVLDDARSSPRLSPEVVIGDIDALIAGGILDDRRVGDTVLDLPTEELRPRLAIFWGYRIARVLGQIAGEDRTAAGIFGTLRPWGLRAQSDDWVAEAVTEFALALLPWQGPDARITRSVWQSWYKDRDLPLHPLFVAAVSIPPVGQIQVRDWLRHSPPQITRKRELFLLLRLTGLAGTNEWPTQGRLQAIRDHYRLIGQSGLGVYFAYVASVILSRSDLTTSQNYASVLGALTGSEDTGVAALIAESAVEAGRRIFGEDTFALLTNVVKFLKRSTEPTYAADYRQHPGPGSSAETEEEAEADPNGTTAHFFWQYFIRATCRKIAEVRGIDAFEDFASVLWFSGTENHVARHVAFRMRQEANVALGAVFRSRYDASDATRQKFVHLVDSLAKGQGLQLPTPEQQEIAFYLIRHTTITGGRPAVVVDETLRPTLQALCHDPRLRANIEGARPTCALNGCEQCKREGRS